MQSNRLLSRVARTSMAAAVLLMLTSYQAASSAPVEPRQKTPAEWQAMARADLDATHALVLSAHPGAIDELNPGFMQWTEDGYRQAQQLIPHVVSYDTAAAAVGFYVSGFLDGHFAHGSTARNGAPVITSGWQVKNTDGDYLVTATLPSWPVALPPKGARLIQCDGRTPAVLIDQYVAPFSDRRDLPSSREGMERQLAHLSLAGALKRCQFDTGSGKPIDFELTYLPARADEVFAMYPAARPKSDKSNGFSFTDGVLWVRADNFQLKTGTAQAAELDTMLKELPRLKGVRHVVFDARKNNGGDSSVGQKMFDAATGGLEFDRKDIELHPRAHAQWRVSDLAISKLAEHLAQSTELYGAQSGPATWASGLLDKLRRAKADGKSWVNQGEGAFRLTRADIAARKGKLRNFSGTVALVTDSNCASACLDFADLVRSVPGSVHVGKPTSADTLYMDIAYTKLPSGNRLVLPVKVWRNRLRGNNEVLTPDIPLQVNMKDDAAVYDATLAALKVHRQQ